MTHFLQKLEHLGTNTNVRGQMTTFIKCERYCKVFCPQFYISFKGALDDGRKPVSQCMQVAGDQRVLNGDRPWGGKKKREREGELGERERRGERESWVATWQQLGGGGKEKKKLKEKEKGKKRRREIMKRK